MKIFNERLKLLRKERNMKQADAASALGIPMRTYQRLETDGSKTYLATAILVAAYYNVSVDWLVGRTDNREINK